MSGQLWTWGESSNGRLGNGTTTPDVTAPAQIGGDDTWARIAAGGDNPPFALAVKDAGTLWSWGSASNGKLGNGTTTPDVTAPAQIGSDTDWLKVAAGSLHGLAIKTGGTLWGWGQNNAGEVGDGSSTQRTSPVQVGVATDWESVSAGFRFSVGIKTGGTLWSWGRKDDGRLGDGTNSGSDVLSPVQVGVATNWAQVACGIAHAAAIRDDGTLWTWGAPYNGKLGQNDEVSAFLVPTQVGAGTDYAQVSCGYEHTIVIKTDGTMWGCGDSSVGQVGDGGTTQRNSFVQIGSDTDWEEVSCGAYHNIARKTDGTLWAWGEAFSGALGNGTTSPNVLAPVQIGSGEDWSSLSAGYIFSMALLTEVVIPPPNAFWTGFVGTSEITL